MQLILTVACVLGLLCGARELNVDPSFTMETYLREPYLFAYSIFQKVATESGENVALSTGALLKSLAVLYEGSAGETEELLADVVKFPTNKQHMRAALHTIQLAISTSVGPHNVYKQGTQVFVAHDIPVAPGFKTLLEKDYPTSDVEQLDFARTDAAAERINLWVNQRTNGSIPTIIKPDALSSATKIAIISAEYFRGLWATPFNPSNTRELPFHVSANETIQVPLMYAKGMYEVVRVFAGGYSLLKLPYQDSGLSCVFVLPDEGKSMSEVVEAARGSFLPRPDIFSNSLQSCEIFVPKFILEASVNLAPVFSQMGRLGNLFSRPANFSSMVDDRLLSINTITQKTRVQVDEMGTTAAAAQEVDITWKMAEKSCRFIINRPFGFVIRDDDDVPLPLVLGVVARPDTC